MPFGSPSAQAGIAGAINRVLLESLTCESDVEVAGTCLVVAEEMTDSAFGFIGELNADGNMDVIAISDPGWDACRVPETDAVVLLKDMVLRGIWSRVLKDGTPLVSNDPPAHPDWFGPPEGHPSLDSFLGVPLNRHGETVGMIGLANREGGYSEAQREAVESLSVAFVEALFNKRAEVELERHRSQLEAIVAERSAELKESEERLRLLAENARDVIWRTDLEGNVSYINRAVEAMLGVTPDEARRITLTEYMTPESIESTRGMLREALSKGDDGFKGEVEYVRPDGTVIPAEFNVTIIRNPDGLAVELEGVSRDISERKKAEEKLHETMENLDRSNKDLEMFAYVASHDLQEPLRMISGYVQLLARRYKGKLDSDADEFIDYAVDGSVRMQKLINDLLSYSRVGTHGQPFEQVDCSAVMNDVLRGLRMSIEESGGRVTFDGLPTITGDPVQIHSLFQNLVANALKFRRDDEPPVVRVSAKEAGEAWELAFEDNGVGIEDRFKDRIFEVFQRLHGRDYPGTGIGLSVCKKIVERHGGRIRLESEPGRGTTFFVTIPREMEEQA